MIFSAGTGNPFFTTDSAACLRGIEIEAEVVCEKRLKWTACFSADQLNSLMRNCIQNWITTKFWTKNLKIMDLAAFTLARDHNLPIRVFNMNKPGALRRSSWVNAKAL